MTKRKIEYRVIPPDTDGEFVANMEEVLETYEKAYDPDRPVVCMDEQPVQLIGETRADSCDEGASGAARLREYERKGTASIYVRRTAQASDKQRLGHAAPRMIGLMK